MLTFAGTNAIHMGNLSMRETLSSVLSADLRQPINVFKVEPQEDGSFLVEFQAPTPGE